MKCLYVCQIYKWMNYTKTLFEISCQELITHYNCRPINHTLNFPLNHPVEILASFWKKNLAQGEIEKMLFSIPDQSVHSTFKEKYDVTQKRLQSIAAMDNLLSGSGKMSLYKHVRMYVDNIIFIITLHCILSLIFMFKRYVYEIYFRNAEQVNGANITD